MELCFEFMPKNPPSQHSGMGYLAVLAEELKAATFAAATLLSCLLLGAKKKWYALNTPTCTNLLA